FVPFSSNCQQSADLVLLSEQGGEVSLLARRREGSGKGRGAVALDEEARQALDEREELGLLDLGHLDQGAMPEGLAAQPAAGKGQLLLAVRLLRIEIQEGEGAGDDPLARFGGLVKDMAVTLIEPQGTYQLSHASCL